MRVTATGEMAESKAAMKIHLVTPRNPPSFWTYDSILACLGKSCVFPNLSMPTVAGLTPGEHELVLSDENVGEIDFDMPADIIGVTGYIAHKPRILEIIREFKRRGRFVVVGGPYASLCPEELRGLCDVLFLHEAEATWPEFLRDFQTGVAKTEYQAVEKPDMTKSPPPRFDLLEIDRYHAMTIQFARGCPFQCEFCDIIVMYGRRPRAKSVPQVMAEISTCHRLGANQVFVVDDNFIGNKKLAKQLLREIASWGRERGYPISFNTEASLNVAQDDELLELLRAANFTTLFIGVESPRLDSLEETRKMQNTGSDLIASIRKIHDFGIQVQAGMIVGFDHDDASIFDEQLEFTQASGIAVSMTGMLQALPRTPLHARISKEGRLLAESTGDQFVFSNIQPMLMTRLELYRGYRNLIERLYDFRNFKRRTLEYLLRRGSQVTRGANLRPGELALFFRIIWHTILRARPRRAWFTVSLLFRAALLRPSVLKEAVAFAVIHKGLYEYMQQLVGRLDTRIAQLEALEIRSTSTR